MRALPSRSGVQFKAGDGVGTVTKAGLPIEPGEPAINPVPRRMMAEVIEEVAVAHGAEPDVEIEISVPGGQELAKQTWNPRLGIVGGISILGTTGIVHPFSCSAWIASIHRGIDVIRAAGLEHAAACTGSTTESAVQQRYGLPDFAFIDMGDFAGAVLKYLRQHPIKRLTLAGGFGKFCKLADGFLDLHSGRSQVNLETLARWAGEHGANDLTRTADQGGEHRQRSADHRAAAEHPARQAGRGQGPAGRARGSERQGRDRGADLRPRRQDGRRHGLQLTCAS